MTTFSVATPKVIPVPIFPRLSPAVAAELVTIETAGNRTPESIVSDEDTAMSDATMLVGECLAGAYISWATADTRELVAGSSNAIERLADALVDGQALAPHDVRAIIRRTSH